MIDAFLPEATVRENFRDLLKTIGNTEWERVDLFDAHYEQCKSDFNGTFYGFVKYLESFWLAHRRFPWERGI